MTKHLYLHIPFCKSICDYCDFCRFKVPLNSPKIEDYIDLLIEQVQNESEPEQYTTIYLGGGTPNYLSDELMKKLLEALSPYLDTSGAYEFCLECNPEFVTVSQAKIFKKYGINRVSLGVQTTNNKILKLLNRQHTIEKAQTAIENLHKANITNISCDFIYALENLVEQDIENAIEFVMKNDIKHVSYYALEVKPGSALAKQGYVVDEEVEADQLEYINQFLEFNGYRRYEVSNWAKAPEFESLHNKAYWLTNDWKGLGYGASGFENRTMYKWEGSLLDWEKESVQISLKDLYLQVLMMGLRLVDGIDVINNERNSEAYAHFFDDIVECYIRNGHLRVKNLNLLHETLVNIVDETKEEQLASVKNKTFEIEEN